MAKRTRESDSDGTTTKAYNTVFIDTSLDTHLAMIVSDTDTVSELKKKIMFEHPQCFPMTGEIKIHALKVKRKGHFYHLSDSMLVRSAFEGAKRNWFLSVDASNPKIQNDNLNCGDDATNSPALLGKKNYPSGYRNNLRADDPSNRLSIINEPSLHEKLKVSCTNHSVPVYSCENVSNDKLITDHEHDIQERHDIISEENKVPETYHKSKDDNMSLQEDSKGGRTAKKKRKLENKDEVGTSLRENGAAVSNSGKETSKPETVISKNSVQDKQKSVNVTSDDLVTKPLENVQLIESTSGGKRKRKKKSSAQCDQVVSDVFPSLQNGGEEGILNEDGKFDPKDLGRASDASLLSGENNRQAIFPEHPGVSQKEKEKHLETVQEVVEGNKHNSSIGNRVSDPENGTVKGKKDDPVVADGLRVKGPKNSKKRLRTEVRPTGPEIIVPSDQRFDSEKTNLIEEERTLSQHHDPAVMVSQKPKPLNLGEAGVNTKESIVSAKLSAANVALESGKSAGRKKTRAKKPVVGLQFSSDAEHDNDPISRTVPSSQAPSSQTLESDLKGRPRKANGDSDVLENRSIDDATIRAEDSRSKGGRINFKDYFVPAPDSGHEVAPADVLVDKVKEAKVADGDPKAKKKMKKPKPSLGDEKKSHVPNSTSVHLQELFSKDEHSDAMLQSNKKSSKVSENGVRAPNSQNVDQSKSISHEPKMVNVVSGSGIKSSNAIAKAISSSSSETYSSSSESSHRSVQNKRDDKNQSVARHHLTAVKASTKTTGEVVTGSQHKKSLLATPGSIGSQHKKSLLATPGSIFRDGSSESSEDENGATNSDASTRTPSDNSSSSGYSEGEGSDGAKTKDGERKHIGHRSGPIGPTNINMQTILKNSSRFKKAKLTASQSQLGDSESEPVDFVPDSQANQ